MPLSCLLSCCPPAVVGKTILVLYWPVPAGALHDHAWPPMLSLGVLWKGPEQGRLVVPRRNDMDVGSKVAGKLNPYTDTGPPDVGAVDTLYAIIRVSCNILQSHHAGGDTKKLPLRDNLFHLAGD